MFKLRHIEGEPFWHTASIIFSYLRMHRNANNSSSFCRPPFSKERENQFSLQPVCLRGEILWTQGGREGKRESVICFEVARLRLSRRTSPLSYPFPGPVFAFSLLSSVCLRRVSTFFSFAVCITPLFSLLCSCQFPPTSKALPHSRTCLRYLKTGSCTQAICNTGAATISCLHHRHRRHHLCATYCLDGEPESMCSRGHIVNHTVIGMDMLSFYEGC